VCRLAHQHRIHLYSAIMVFVFRSAPQELTPIRTLKSARRLAPGLSLTTNTFSIRQQDIENASRSAQHQTSLEIHTPNGASRLAH
jgi:hypothetical protein